MIRIHIIQFPMLAHRVPDSQNPVGFHGSKICRLGNTRRIFPNRRMQAPRGFLVRIIFGMTGKEEQQA